MDDPINEHMRKKLYAGAIAHGIGLVVYLCAIVALLCLI